MTQTMTINDQLVELGSLVYNEDTAVQRVGARLIDKYLTAPLLSDVDDETIANVLYYLTDIQVRDYALGLIGDFSSRRTEVALANLINKAPTDSIYINAPAALLAQHYYEQGNTADAFLTLTNAQPDYSLALLLDRVFKAKFSPSGFARMREELHPKVVAGIFGEEN